MPKFDDEVFRGLGRPALGINDILHDDATSPRKFTKGIPVQVSPEMYQAMQEMVAHRALPFDGNMSAFVRHCVGNNLEELEDFLDDNSRTIYRALVNQQKRMTRERFIVTIEDTIDQQVDILRFWTVKAKWSEVIRGLVAFASEVQEYPVAVWREHAATMWVRNAGLKELLKVWTHIMKEDSPHDWQVVERVWKEMETLSNA